MALRLAARLPGLPMCPVGEEDDLELQEKQKGADWAVENPQGKTRDNYGGEG